MKKYTLLILCSLLILSGCSNKSNNITFVGVVENISENSILISTEDNTGLDMAKVGITEETKLIGKDFGELDAGDVIEIEILPEIRESYPVQVTAVNITYIKGEDTMEYRRISPKEAKEIIDNKDVIILDVRTQEEYDEGHIENSILIPDSDIERLAPEMLKEKDAKILIYCRSGRRSAFAAYKLMDMGYSQVYDFGGIIDWEYRIVR